MIRSSAPLRSLAALVLLAAFAARMLIPAGWMPSADRAFAITVCTGIDTQTLWLGTDGKTHQEDPSKLDGADHQPCTSAGAAMAHALPSTTVEPAMVPAQAGTVAFAGDQVAIGRGLAAPPPPSTGPPALI